MKLKQHREDVDYLKHEGTDYERQIAGRYLRLIKWVEDIIEYDWTDIRTNNHIFNDAVIKDRRKS